jgi:hypothetical protein
MKSKKLEYGSHGVMVYRGHGLADQLFGAGPETGVPTKTREAGPCEKRRLGRRGFTAFTTLCGNNGGKFTGFYLIATRCYRLRPDKSTLVVDFPHLSGVRLFWGSPKNRKSDGHKYGKTGNGRKAAAGYKGKINHIYASRYIDFYACNSD